MLLNWKEDRLLVVEVIGVPGARPMITLFPGVNEVSDAEWDGIKGALALKLEGKNPSLEPLPYKVSAGPGVKGGKTVTAFKDMPVDRACVLVENTTNLTDLKKWLKESTKDEVRLSIRNRIESLTENTGGKKTDLDSLATGDFGPAPSTDDGKE